MIEELHYNVANNSMNTMKSDRIIIWYDLSVAETTLVFILHK